jgi:hypothetical protein
LAKFVEVRKQQAAEAPKIQEVAEDKTRFKKVQISEESSEDSDDEGAVKAKAEEV